MSHYNGTLYQYGLKNDWQRDHVRARLSYGVLQCTILVALQARALCDKWEDDRSVCAIATSQVHI